MGCATKWTEDKHSAGSDTPVLTKSNTVVLNGKQGQSVQENNNVISYRYLPVPIPGQLMPMPTFNETKKNENKAQSAEDIVKSANKKALMMPEKARFFNSIQTYPFIKGALYTILTSPGKITDIEFESGEKLLNIATADSANWQVQTSPSGSEKNQVEHLLIKPMVSNATDNSIVVLTDKRTYHLYLKMTDNGTFMVSAKWQYPNEDGSMFVKQSKKNKNAGSNLNFADPADMMFDYHWRSKNSEKPEWYPVRIFHDNTRTYIQYPKGFNNQTELPILYIPDGNGDYSTMTNWRLDHAKNLLIVDGVLKEAMLKTGSVKGKQFIVVIRKTADEKS